MKIGLIQQASSASPPANLQKIEDSVRAVATQDVQLIVLPELHNTRYFCQTEDTANFDLAEPVPGPTTQMLGALARELRVVIVGSVFERRDAGLYHNTAVVLDANGSLAGSYRKMHIPDDPGYHEKFYFTPGDLGFTPIDTSLGRLGVLICWDQWFPEAARLMTLAGAKILIYPTAIGWDPADEPEEQTRQYQAWHTIQRAHAIANGVPVIACNRTGIEADPSGATGGIHFWGGSFACGPQGEVLAQASTDQNEVLVVDIDLNRSEQVRRIWPYLRDRRIDAYDELKLRFRDQSSKEQN